MIARNKHSSLLPQMFSDEEKKFFNIDTQCQSHKTFFLYFMKWAIIEFVPGYFFHASLIFASKAGAYPSGAPFRCSRPTFQHYTRLWKLARDKHSSLFCRCVSDEEKKGFYDIDTRLYWWRGEDSETPIKRKKFYILILVSYYNHCALLSLQQCL
jgi:hypothetical protein